MNATEIVVQAIRDHLTRQCLSVRQAAEIAEVGRTYLQDVLMGNREPTLEWALETAEKLGISVSLRVKSPRTKAAKKIPKTGPNPSWRA